ncbi:MAG: hypothetical protein EOO41_04465 [Methanobacteriota archaeon]|nr:MAG: hypothetical protein EOO41_04465 [Euryarchaeota archaeon]
MQAVVRLRLEEDARSPLRVAPLDALHRPLPPSYRRRQHWIAATSTLASSAAAAPLNESLRGYGTPRSVSPRLRLEGGDTRPLDARLASSVRSGRSTQLVSSRAGAARHREDSQSDLHAREARHVARVLMGASPAAASGTSLATSSIVPLAPRGIAAAVVGHAGSLVHEDAAIHTSAAVMPHVGEGRRPHPSALIAALQPLQVDDDYMSPPPSSSSTPLERHVYVVPTLSQADRAAIDAAAAAAVVRAEATRTSLQSALPASSSRTPSPRASTRGRGASAASYKRIVSGLPAARTVLASRATPLLVQPAAAHTSALLLQETTAADTIRRIGSVTLRQVTQSARVTEPTVLLTSSNM